MINRILPALAAALAISASWLPTAVVAQDKYVAADMAAGEVQSELIVEAKDTTRRLLTLRDRSGRAHEMYVSEQVKAFDKVKAGDEIVVNYRAAVAIALKKDGKGQRELVEATASGPLTNYETGRQVTQRTTLTAAVEAYDAKTQIATLRGPKGRVVDVKVVDPVVAKELKKGDQVVAVVSESLAVALWPKAEVDAARKAGGK